MIIFSGGLHHFFGGGDEQSRTDNSAETSGRERVGERAGEAEDVTGVNDNG